MPKLHYKIVLYEDNTLVLVDEQEKIINYILHIDNEENIKELLDYLKEVIIEAAL